MISEYFIKCSQGCLIYHSHSLSLNEEHARLAHLGDCISEGAHEECCQYRGVHLILWGEQTIALIERGKLVRKWSESLR